MKKNEKTAGTSGSQTPKNIRVNTQTDPCDIEPIPHTESGPVSELEVEDAVEVINPDPASMESRG
ncbi:hypothetical protein LJC45_05255 [Alistipes sp. OttesenSCG-928-B03]|nr:hypothetical protein [Alistipes sp. OttesenSCG-928-B03]